MFAECVTPQSVRGSFSLGVAVTLASGDFCRGLAVTSAFGVIELFLSRPKSAIYHLFVIHLSHSYFS